MIKKIKWFLLLVLVMSGCEEFDLSNDSNYPTTIYRIDPDDLSNMIIELNEKNAFLRTSLNQFGFCAFAEADADRIVDYPPVTEMLDESEAIEVIKSFIVHNKDLTGVTDLDNLNFTYSNFRDGLWNGSSMWSFKTTNQIIDTVEVIKSKIIFHVLNEEISWCAGNWYPNVYIPGKFNYSSGKAKPLLLNKVVTHYGWG